MTVDDRHPSLRVEAKESWEWHTKRMASSSSDSNDISEGNFFDRRLKHHNHRKHHLTPKQKRTKKLDDLYSDPGIKHDSMHGMMIDAGSSGSRMHVYEFNARVLEGRKETSEAVSGKKLSFPGTASRWTDRLHPGISSLASLGDDELLPVRINIMIRSLHSLLNVSNSRNFDTVFTI